ncbi:transaldolase [Ancylothrix sp. C2]|uniref:transaldolase n=1 Tax=Ancylothrix sp. D3o TaxID=2953691 RepID=UPI0021BA6369|nr:transaldolase [Ancylothrix sp. D3o]MCT7950456.1 transaldolase [Ancylothrix sp. D3o]
MANNPLLQIEQDYNQSIWMDNLTRNLIQSGELKEMITTRGIVGITSNPAIFQKAISGNVVYDADIEAGIKAGKSVQDIYESLVFDDIRNACDIFRGIYQQSDGLDGYVSIEVPPDLAHNAEKTIAEAKRYYSEIGRDNVMIKIPGTPEGLRAVEEVIAAGINVNVTLLFSVQSYVETAWAFIRGLEARAAKGEDISNIASVASFFISRIDINVDARLDKLIEAAQDDAKKEELRAMKGKFAIANAKIAYQKYKEIIQTDRWKALSAKGAKMQRLLWASTGTKDPNYSDVLYVDELIGPNTVNTLPPATIEACADHCDVASRIETNVEEAYKLAEELPKLGINLDEVMDELIIDGIDKFIQPFESLIKSLQEKVDKLMPV